MSSADVAAPPPPEEPLQYPIDFASGAGNEDGLGGTSHDAALRSVSIFSALYWLKPLFELADWIPVERAHRLTNNIKGESEETSPSSGNSKRAAATPDVQSALQLLPQFEKFFEVSQRLVSQQEDLLYTVTSFTIPTPKGPKVITRSKVEGEHRARIHSVKEPTLTNTTAVFSLLPGHNQFLVYYEAREKLGHFNYLELDKLRFAWVAMRDLLEECKVFNLHDGTPTGLARRDLKKNNSASPFSLSPVLAAPKGPTAESSAMSASPSASKSSPSVGRGGGNARLHQGTSGNVITGPSKAVIQEKKEMAAKRFLKDELEDECRRRWPHTPVEKSCVYAVEEKMECDLPEDVVAQMGLPSRNNCNRKNTARKGPRFYFGTVELPLLNKKGGVAKFKAPRWWANRNDAINAAAETAVMALRSMK